MAPAWEGAEIPPGRPVAPRPAATPAMTVGELLRTALQLLESERADDGAVTDDESLATSLLIMAPTAGRIRRDHSPDGAGAPAATSPARRWPELPPGAARRPAREPVHPHIGRCDGPHPGRRGVGRLLARARRSSASSTRNWSSSGSTAIPSSDGSSIAGATPCSRPRIPASSPRNSDRPGRTAQPHPIPPRLVDQFAALIAGGKLGGG